MPVALVVLQLDHYGLSNYQVGGLLAAVSLHRTEALMGRQVMAVPRHEIMPSGMGGVACAMDGGSFSDIDMIPTLDNIQEVGVEIDPKEGILNVAIR